MKYSSLLFAILFFGCSSTIKQDLDEFMEDEDYRPKYHFTPAENWMNDPNGMVYYEGEYHLFYQYYPEGNVWGPMHWGHAVSRDMINWEHLPIALYPDSLGYIFSGSAVIDWNNTSGLGSEGNPPMVAIYTYHDPVGAEAGRQDFQTQGVAFSLDKGRTWQKYEHNPVLSNPGIVDFRDPKVFWDDKSQQWTMILAVKDHVNIYSSPNLIEWNKESEFGHSIGAHGGVWECPDLFTLTTESGKKKWVMLVSINPGGPQGGSATQYFIGDFDGSTFIPDSNETRWLDYGADNYAGVTWSDIPEKDGRRLFIGWMSNWQYATVVPTNTWRSAMTIPRALYLKESKEGYLLSSKPVDELKSYFGKASVLKSDEPIAQASFKLDVTIMSLPAKMIFRNGLNEQLIITFDQNGVTVDRTKSGKSNFSDVFAAIHTAPFALSTKDEITMYFDHSSVEVFVNNGQLVITDLFFLNQPISEINFPNDLEVYYQPFINQSNVQ